jgi:membrane-associated phospholipid phosphatase
MDWSLFHAVNSLQVHTGWAHAPFRLYAKDGIVVFVVLLLAGWVIGRVRGARTLATAISAGAAALVGLAVNQLLGHLFGRVRPYATHAGVHLLVGRTSDFSFPSDHAVVAGAVAAGLLFVDRRLGVVTVLAAVVMAFARVYVGAHYPGDVVAGLAVGALVAVALQAVLVPLLVPVLDRVATTPLRPVVRA